MTLKISSYQNLVRIQRFTHCKFMKIKIYLGVLTEEKFFVVYFFTTICILIKQLFKVIHVVPAYVLYYISIICYFLIYSVKLTFKQFSRLQKSSINFHHKNSLSLSFYDIVIKCIFIFNRTDFNIISSIYLKKFSFN